MSKEKQFEEILKRYCDESFEDHFDTKYISSEANLIKALNEAHTLGAQESKWISVETELPEDDCRVIAFTNAVDVPIISNYYTDGSFWNKLHRITDLVTHWQKLPTPPNS